MRVLLVVFCFSSVHDATSRRKERDSSESKVYGVPALAPSFAVQKQMVPSSESRILQS